MEEILFSNQQKCGAISLARGLRWQNMNGGEPNFQQTIYVKCG